jgi:hypothetical protein
VPGRQDLETGPRRPALHPSSGADPIPVSVLGSWLKLRHGGITGNCEKMTY